jgi:uncharacterized protein YbaR (Trm112 family)
MDLHVFEEKNEVITGLLFCPKCSRWYPVKEKLPEILPDNQRMRAYELSFLREWRKLLPQKVVTAGEPFNLRKAVSKASLKK